MAPRGRPALWAPSAAGALPVVAEEEEVVRLTALIGDWKKSLPAGPSGEVFSELRQEKK